jgi:hypothetical protein
VTIPLNQIGSMVFRRANHTKLSDYAKDIKTFNVLGALDGKRSVEEIAAAGRFDPQYLEETVKALYDQGLIEKAVAHEISRGQAKKILDAIIRKRSRGVGAIAKTIRVKFALKGINPDSLTPNTPDDPVLLKKLVQLARSYGLQVQFKRGQARRSEQTKGKTKLILDSIITQRSGGDPDRAKVIKVKLMLKGVNADAYSLDTPDDPNLVKKLIDLAGKLGVAIPTVPADVDDRIEQFL